MNLARMKESPRVGVFSSPSPVEEKGEGRREKKQEEREGEKKEEKREKEMEGIKNEVVRERRSSNKSKGKEEKREREGEGEVRANLQLPLCNLLQRCVTPLWPLEVFWRHKWHDVPRGVLDGRRRREGK
jgi:hypothetical protein